MMFTTGTGEAEGYNGIHTEGGWIFFFSFFCIEWRMELYFFISTTVQNDGFGEL